MSDRLSEYFAQEAGEYLEQLDRLLSQPDAAPDAERLLRLARGVRGSAQMAGAEGIASVAQRLEDGARSLLARSLDWSEEVRTRALETVGDLRALVAALRSWGEAEEARIRTALERWDGDGGPAPAPARAPAPAAAQPVVPISDLFYDDEGPHIVEPVAGESAAEEDVVPVEQLFLRGDDALREAVALRPRLEEELRTRGALDPEVAALLDEFFDLLNLGLTPSGPE